MVGWGAVGHFRLWFVGFCLFWMSPGLVADDDIALVRQPLPERMVVIPDVHGDLPALVRILREMGLIDSQEGRWTGADTVVVFLGDLVDRGSDSLAVMSLVMRLKSESQAVGGRVHSLLGNHELMMAQGDWRDFDQSERAELIETIGRQGLHQTFRNPRSPFAQEISSLPLLLQYGPFVFVHAGLHEHLAQMSIAEINLLAREMVSEFQDAPIGGLEHDSRAAQAIESSLWLRPTINPSQEADRADDVYRPQDIDRILQFFEGAETVVVGHQIVDEVQRLHLPSGRELIMLDTGMSAPPGEQRIISALEIVNGTIEVRRFNRARENQVTRRIRDACVNFLKSGFGN